MTLKRQQIVKKYRKLMQQKCRAVYSNWLEGLTDQEFLEVMQKVAASDEAEIEKMLLKRTHVKI